MSVTLDGQELFDGLGLVIEPGSFTRSSIERAVAGLDGMLSIDLGSRGRKIKQSGTLRAKSSSLLNERIQQISARMDGTTHTLVTQTGLSYENLRADSFKVNNQRTDGAAVVVDYEIMYTQLL